MMKPETEEALAEAIRSASGPLAVCGGGTRGLNIPGEALSVSAITGITLYEPGALTLVARAGTPVAEIEAALAKEGQRLAFEPRDMRELLKTDGTPTIGGVIATNASGPRRVQTGAARDFALGVRFVDGQGNIVKNGGRVMKNVTGYDLVKLMCGAHGTLGVLTEVALKVLPIPETNATLMLRDLDEATAIRAMSAALQSPYEVTGAAHCASILKDRPVTALRIEGFADSVAYRMEKLKVLMANFATTIEPACSEMSDWFWTGVANYSGMADLEGDIWRVSCKPSEAAALAARAGAENQFFDWGGGMICLRMKPGSDLRANLGAFDGHATLLRASAETIARLDRFQPEAPAVARISAGLRARFDPRGILNPGLMGPLAQLEDA